MSRLVEVHHLRLLLILRPGQAQRERDETRAIEPGVDVRQVQHGPQQQAGADDQRDRERNLAGHEKTRARDCGRRPPWCAGPLL